jgi:hypothetical protein
VIDAVAHDKIGVCSSPDPGGGRAFARQLRRALVAATPTNGSLDFAFVGGGALVGQVACWRSVRTGPTDLGIALPGGFSLRGGVLLRPEMNSRPQSRKGDS